MTKNLESAQKVTRVGDSFIRLCEVTPLAPVQLYAFVVKTALRLHQIPTLQDKARTLVEYLATYGTADDIMRGISITLTHYDTKIFSQLPVNAVLEFFRSGVKKYGPQIFSNDRIDYLAQKWTGGDQYREEILFSLFLDNFKVDLSVDYKPRFIRAALESMDLRQSSKLTKYDTWINLFAHAFTPRSIISETAKRFPPRPDYTPEEIALIEAIFHGLRIKTGQLVKDKILPRDKAEREGFLNQITPLTRFGSHAIKQNIAEIALLITPKGSEHEITEDLLTAATVSDNKRIRARAQKETERRKRFPRGEIVNVFVG